MNARPGPADAASSRDPRERREAASRLVLASLEEDHAAAAGILNAEVDGKARVEVKLFMFEVAAVAAHIARGWESGTPPVIPVADLIRAQLEGPVEGLVRGVVLGLIRARQEREAAETADRRDAP